MSQDRRTGDREITTLTSQLISDPYVHPHAMVSTKDILFPLTNPSQFGNNIQTSAVHNPCRFFKYWMELLLSGEHPEGGQGSPNPSSPSINLTRRLAARRLFRVPEVPHAFSGIRTQALRHSPQSC
ncbi:hypothetical protein TNCV_3460611 [Trichonephila clavipes]|nr:hypothetical protein TNCV_3460611 [Trichonephila clavipes]